MKKLYFLQKNLLGLLCIWCTYTGFSQVPSGIIWDKEVACQESRNEYFFDVEDEQECVKVCSGSTVTYTLVGGDSSTWVSTDWQISGGNIIAQTLTTVTVNWSGTTTGSLFFTITLNNGVSFDQELCIEKTPKPRAIFNLAPFSRDASDELQIPEIQACVGETLYFENFSDSNGGSSIVDYFWQFGSDEGWDYSYDFEPSYTFTQSGDYTIVLTVTNACNCKSSIEVPVEVGEEGVKIECVSMVCEGSSDEYTAYLENGETLECEAASWEAEGGSILYQNATMASVKWDNVDEDGFGYLTYFPEGCDVACISPTTIKVPVIQNDIEIDGPEEICEGEQFRYSIPKWPTTEVNWQILSGSAGQLFTSDQKNEIIFQANGPGTFIIEAEYTNTLLGCGGTATKEIKVKPGVEIEGPTRLCVGGGTASFNLSNNDYAHWQLMGPAGNTTAAGYTFTHQFNQPGIYQLGATGNFCLTKEYIIQVDETPEAPISIEGPEEVCLGEPVAFSVVNSGTGQGTVYWEAENGSVQSSSGSEATIAFLTGSNGPFVVKARNQNGICTSEWISKTVEQVQLDTTISGAATACSSTYETYSVPETEGDKYTWTITPDYLGSVTNANQDNEVEILWNDVTTPEIATLQIAIEKCGQTYFGQQQVTVQMAPEVNINAPTEVCRDEPVYFSLQSPGGLSSWDSIEWDFGDGNTASNTETPTHTYTVLDANQLNYNVTVTVQGANGCIGEATANFSINVMPAPVGVINPATAPIYCNASELTNNPASYFLNINTNYPSPTSIQWFHNGQQMGNPPYNPATGEFTPTQFGGYYALIEGNNGCSTQTNTLSIELEDCGTGPGVSCTPSGSIVDVSAQLTDCGTVELTSGFTGNPINYTWLAPEGILQNETINSAALTYSSSGVKTVRYQATFNGVDDQGQACTTVLTRSVQVIVPYLADINYAVSCESTPGMYNLTLYDASTYVAGISNPNIAFWVDGSPVGPVNNGQVSNLAVSPGQHTLKIEVSSANYPSCTVSLPIDLVDFPTATIVAPNEACVGMPVNFSAQVNDPDLSYKWDFRDGAKNSLPNPVRNFSSGNNYDVVLTVTNRYGCTVEVSQEMNIQESNMAGTIELNPQSACLGETIDLFFDQASNTITPTEYYWTIGGNIVANTPSFPVTQPGEYGLIVESSGGCQETIVSKTVTFLDTPVAQIIAPEEVCSESPFSLQSRRKKDGDSYTWRRDGQLLYQFNDEPVIEQQLGNTGTYTYQLEITAASGCTDTANFTVTVYPNPEPPEVDFQVLDCEPYTVRLTGTAGEPGTFTWSSGGEGAQVEVNKGGPYRLTFTNQYGCSSSTEIDVPFNPLAHIWVHPTGCYEGCEQLIKSGNQYLSGPDLPFQAWEWTRNNSTLNSGTGSVQDQVLGSDGNYRLHLDNGSCQAKSEPMEWSISPHCRECRLEYLIEDVRPAMDAYGNCYYIISLNIANPNPSLSYNIQNTSGNGVIVPGGGVLPSGNNIVQLEFYPNSGFGSGGGQIDLLLTASNAIPGEPSTCYLEFSVNLPPCGGSSHRPGQDMNLILSPNPTNSSTTLRIEEGLNDQKGSRTIELYDLNGKRLTTQQLAPNQKEWAIDLSGYAGGTYLVVIRDQGEVMGYKRLYLKP